MKGLAVLFIVLGLLVGGYYFATAFRHRMDRPHIYWHLGYFAHVIAWLFIGLAILGIRMLL